MEKEKKYTITQEETQNQKSKNQFSNIWKDSVFSKVIANGILLLFTLLAIIIGQLINVSTAEEFIKYFFNFEVKLYVLLLTAGIIFIGYYLYLKFLKKKDDGYKSFLSQIVGDYKFANLNNILLTSYEEIPPVLQKEMGSKELDLLTLFKITIPLYSSGMDWDNTNDESGFLYYRLGPRLISYGLLERVPSIDNNTEGNINAFTIQPSQNGFKFFALLESFERIENSESYEKEFDERQKKNASH
ncbi:hypothetical protein [Flavobacterium marginilacus]|uniref:hypothetical protein n=1 Tax=Flavobacterium marginilacus TaxID=3003256 RepID=UPI00248EA076|nr:hypothetical protein [Flavobacterium marginilacus]